MLSTVSLQCENLTVRQSHQPLFSQANFTVKPGDILVILGNNGTGKSTLLQTLAGLHTNYQGSILVNNQPMRSMALEHRRKLIAWHPQNLRRPDAFSAIDVVALSTSYDRFLRGRDTYSQTELALFLKSLRIFDAEHLAERDVSSLSGGEWTRVCLARTKAQQCPWVLLDEPTTGLDWAHIRNLVSILKDWVAREKTGIILSTHETLFAQAVGSQFLLIQNKRCEHAQKNELSRHLLTDLFEIPFQNYHDILVPKL